MSETATKERPAAMAGAQPENGEADIDAVPGGQKPAAPRMKRDEADACPVPDLGDDPAQWWRGLADCFGTGNFGIASYFATGLMRCLPEPDRGRPDAVNALIAACAAVAPKDELEGMMAAQLAALHAAAMANFSVVALISNVESTFRRDAEGKRDPGPDRTNAGVRCVRAFALQREALDRLRTGRLKKNGR
jgi:hypothetical protein